MWVSLSFCVFGFVWFEVFVCAVYSDCFVVIKVQTNVKMK